MATILAGPLAVWAWPDTGGAPTSYPAPTRSAAKGPLESIAFLSNGEAWWHPTRVELCRQADKKGGEIRFQRYATNYNGPLRNKQNVADSTPMQFFVTVLAGVCYRIHAEVRGPRVAGQRNPHHRLQDPFVRRLERGQCFRTRALGWREFTCDYWGPLRDEWVMMRSTSSFRLS